MGFMVPRVLLDELDGTQARASTPGLRSGHFGGMATHQSLKRGSSGLPMLAR
jgi:hypothetical protein